MPRQQARILVIEDDGAIRRSLASALRREGYEVLTLENGLGVEEDADRFGPDLVVLDVRLRVGPDGYEVARTLRRRKNVAILFLTAADTLRARLDGFEVGGDDYLTKPFELEELLARVRALLRRLGRSSGGIVRVGDLVLDHSAHVANLGGVRLNLRRVEFDLLSVFARHPGQVLSKKQLLTLVWGYDAHDINRVEVQVSRLRKKLEAAGPRLIHTVHQVGYVLRY